MFLTDLQNEWDVLLKAGSRMVPVKITKEGSRLFFKFGYNKPLMAEIKEMEGSKYHGYDDNNPRKVWSVTDCERNHFQLAYLAAPGSTDPNNPYFWYDQKLTDRMPGRTLYAHQVDLFKHGYTYHYCIFGAEMGTGKTLSAFEVIEACGATDILYVAPKPAIVSVKLEYAKWGCKFPLTYCTYDGLKKIVAEWPKGKKSPQVVIFDESSRIKNYTAQRTQSARHLAASVRKEWGKDGFVIEMTGSPAPKSPVDWWSQCEIAQPGFIKEGTVEKFKRRLAVIETRSAFEGGGAYPHLVTWKDDPLKCNLCGLPADAETHISSGVDVMAAEQTSTYHVYEPSINEIDHLFKRMKGLVLVKLKKDCLDLPDKIYREVECKPSRSTLNAASAISATAPNAITAMTRLRELSDGFQYIDKVVGTQVCTVCHGKKTYLEPVYPEEMQVTEADMMRGYTEDMAELGVKFQMAACPFCNATGVQDKIERTTHMVPTPKEAALRDLLDECDDQGRIVVYGGFTGSVDRICEITQKEQWKFIRVDGRGWFSDLPYTKPEDLMKCFQHEQVKYPKISFNAQPSSAGMGLTLTAASLICYWSNDFNGESRIQSEDRIHRMGMDVNRGATIVDLLHLPTDRKVLENLKKKRRLQDISMGELQAALARAEQEFDGRAT